MITREKLSFMTETGAVTVDFQNAAAQNPDETSWSVLRENWTHGWLNKPKMQVRSVLQGFELIS